jgi:hypothetical protein
LWAAATGDECARVGNLGGALGWRVLAGDDTDPEQQYWDDEFDPNEHDLIVEYFVSNEDEETRRI